MQKKSLIALIAALICGMLTGYVNLTATEVQAPMFCLLLFGFVLGLYQPKGAWRWALIVGLSVPLSYVAALISRFKVADAPHPITLLIYPTTLVVLVIPTLVATYVGVLLRRAFSAETSSAVE